MIVSILNWALCAWIDHIKSIGLWKKSWMPNCSIYSLEHHYIIKIITNDMTNIALRCYKKIFLLVQSLVKQLLCHRYPQISRTQSIVTLPKKYWWNFAKSILMAVDQNNDKEGLTSNYFVVFALFSSKLPTYLLRYYIYFSGDIYRLVPGSIIWFQFPITTKLTLGIFPTINQTLQSSCL